MSAATTTAPTTPQELRDAFDGGTSVVELGKLVGAPPGQVAAMLREGGRDVRWRSKAATRLAEGSSSALLRAWRAGATQEEIIAATGIDRPVVARIVRRMPQGVRDEGRAAERLGLLRDRLVEPIKVPPRPLYDAIVECQRRDDIGGTRDRLDPRDSPEAWALMRFGIPASTWREWAHTRALEARTADLVVTRLGLQWEALWPDHLGARCYFEGAL